MTSKKPLKPFDPAMHLDNKNVIREYLELARNDPDPQVYQRALENVAKAELSEPAMSEPHQPNIDQSFTTKELIDQLSPHIEQFLRVYGPAINAFATKVVPQVLELIAQIPRRWKEYVARIDALTVESKQAMQLALDKGWFLGWFTSYEDVFSLIEGIKALQSDQMDDYLSAYFRENFDHFVSQLVERYPERGQAIRAAARAHKELGDEGFYLSIPVFIAQGDGITAQILDVENPFQKERNIEATKAGFRLQKRFHGDQKSLDLLQPVFAIRQSDFMKSSGSRGSVFNALNRHQVMHGESSSYASELNSLKAFSFLAFFGLHIADLIPKSELNAESVEAVTTKACS